MVLSSVFAAVEGVSCGGGVHALNDALHAQFQRACHRAVVSSALERAHNLIRAPFDGAR